VEEPSGGTDDECDTEVRVRGQADTGENVAHLTREQLDCEGNLAEVYRQRLLRLQERRRDRVRDGGIGSGGGGSASLEASLAGSWRVCLALSRRCQRGRRALLGRDHPATILATLQQASILQHMDQVKFSTI
jgi:hypothetical protein